ERDILVPLGLEQAAEADEIRSCLTYAAAIGPALRAASGSDRRGMLAVEAGQPSASIVVDAGPTVTVRNRRPDDVVDLELRGSAVDLIEGLSFRAPLRHDATDDSRWLLGGLDEVFDVAR